jgi:hypothetical protein
MVFFSFVIDVFSRRIVGWQFAGHMPTDLVLDALRMALTRRHAGADVDLIHHSDAGPQPELNRSSQQCVGERTVRMASDGFAWAVPHRRGWGDAAGVAEARFVADQHGVPRDQVRFVHDARNDAEKGRRHDRQALLGRLLAHRRGRQGRVAAGLAAPARGLAGWGRRD